jgi:Raf kinase inhibitor-like YbhB/YbcL family protein
MENWSMKLWSNSWINGDRIPARYAAGKPDVASIVTQSDNLNPHLAWSEVPAGTQSFALICHDFDVPSRGDDVNKPDREVPSDLPRVDFFHWVLVDLPGSLREIAEGEFSRGGLTARGKPGPATLHGARHGLNDYTGWFAADPAMAGQYFGYDGPFPPFNDSLVHHYVFTLYALSVPRVPVEGAFTGPQVRQALHAHVLAEATHSGTYTLNRRLL